jgi:hypothetical protein
MVFKYWRFMSMFTIFYALFFAPHTSLGPLGIHQWTFHLGLVCVIIVTWLEVRRYVKIRTGFIQQWSPTLPFCKGEDDGTA